MHKAYQSYAHSRMDLYITYSKFVHNVPVCVILTPIAGPSNTDFIQVMYLIRISDRKTAEKGFFAMNYCKVS